jgi:putative ABC transport system ATP-binding protein
MIVLKNITKSFPGLFRPVLNDVKLSIDPGDFCVLIGSNGCGKSTLLKLISKEYLPDSGTISLSADVAYVTQDVNLGTIPELSLLENITLSEIRSPKLSLYSRCKEEVIKKIKELGIGIEAHLHQPLKMLSGGQRQMVATLMAVNSGRKILLLDEHTSALDPKMQDVLMTYTDQVISKMGITTIMITHKMDEAIKYGNRLIMLHKGKVVLDLNGPKKKKLKVEDLLALFHAYEDQILISGVTNDH